MMKSGKLGCCFMKDNTYIERIRTYSEKIIKYMMEVKTFPDFENNDEKKDAVIFNLEQIGETAKKLSDETKKKYPSILWPKIIGLRNMISHEYEGIRSNIIHDIAKSSIPELLASLDAL
jgi:uncharacterized protein with HEPN domain